MGDWIWAARPRTLPLALSGLALGNLIAAHRQDIHLGTAALSIATAFLLQVFSNLANDLGDYSHGADNQYRLGPPRALQSGRLQPAQVKYALWLLGGLAFLTGLWLLWSAREALSVWVLAAMLGLGLASIAAAYGYTASKKPYGYQGLGDLSVMFFFGPLAVTGAYLLQTGRVDWPALALGLGFGSLATGVLNLNNMRDVDNDRACGKMTLAVRLGPGLSKVYHSILVLAGGGIFLAYGLINFDSLAQYLFLTPLTLLVRHCIKVIRTSEPAAFNLQLKELSLVSAACALSIGTALHLSHI
ncbi:MAG: 1,4-dihydroxy-2-naphthoate octaprenyltransferase [Bacteroidetes bacterium]|nr:1,4-dihydroxy-2-naphthoate octaprenyltransferase [Bacteroidota bacterium]